MVFRILLRFGIGTMDEGSSCSLWIGSPGDDALR